MLASNTYFWVFAVAWFGGIVIGNTIRRVYAMPHSLLESSAG